MHTYNIVLFAIALDSFSFYILIIIHVTILFDFNREISYCVVDLSKFDNDVLCLSH